jgi:hypothetical protein
MFRLARKLSQAFGLRTDADDDSPSWPTNSKDSSSRYAIGSSREDYFFSRSKSSRETSINNPFDSTPQSRTRSKTSHSGSSSHRALQSFSAIHEESLEREDEFKAPADSHYRGPGGSREPQNRKNGESSRSVKPEMLRYVRSSQHESRKRRATMSGAIIDGPMPLSTKEGNWCDSTLDPEAEFYAALAKSAAIIQPTARRSETISRKPVTSPQSSNLPLATSPRSQARRKEETGMRHLATRQAADQKGKRKASEPAVDPKAADLYVLAPDALILPMVPT